MRESRVGVAARKQRMVASLQEIWVLNVSPAEPFLLGLTGPGGAQPWKKTVKKIALQYVDR